MIDSQSVRERILEAAEKRVRGAGYHAVSFRDLANDVGVKSSSVHYYFPQKEDLGAQLVKHYSDRFLAHLEMMNVKTDPPLIVIQKFLEQYSRALVIGKSMCLCAILGAQANSLPERVNVGVREFFQANIDWLKIIYDRMPPSKNVMSPTEIISALEGAMIVSTTMKNRKAFDAVLQQIEESYSK